MRGEYKWIVLWVLTSAALTAANSIERSGDDGAVSGHHEIEKRQAEFVMLPPPAPDVVLAHVLSEYKDAAHKCMVDATNSDNKLLKWTGSRSDTMHPFPANITTLRNKAIRLSHDNTALIVPLTGMYRVYAQVTFSGLKRQLNHKYVPDISVNYKSFIVIRKRPGLPEDEFPLAQAKMGSYLKAKPKPNTAPLPCQDGDSLHTSGMFYLRANESLAVKIDYDGGGSNLEINAKEQNTFFGVELISTGNPLQP